MQKEFKYIEKIDSIEKESIYIKKCFSAMRMLAANPQIVKDTDDKNSSIIERNYILSMVYNMGKADYLRDNPEFFFCSSSYFVGGENIKHITPTGKKVEKTRKELKFSLKDNEIEVLPDLVIHNSHNPSSGNSDDGQFLVLEAKTTSRLGEYYFMRDLFKLNLYIEKLNYQNAVYLVINKSADTIDNFIAVYKEKGYFLCDDLKSKLRIFIQEKDRPELYKLK